MDLQKWKYEKRSSGGKIIKMLNCMLWSRDLTNKTKVMIYRFYRKIMQLKPVQYR